jgi:cell division transport system permease protein
MDELGEGADELLSGYTGADNPLSRELQIDVTDIRSQREVITQREALGEDGVRKVTHGMDVADMLVAANNVLRIISLVVISTLGIISVLIIMNTIKLTVNNRRTEISIMKYVGATDWFIRWPFVIEGLLIGFIGAIIPSALCWYGYGGAIDMIAESFPALDTLLSFREAVTIFTVLFPLAIVLGMLIGIIGSASSMRKYLKV